MHKQILAIFNSQAKAERCIFALGDRVKSWRRVESMFSDKAEYLVWYEPTI